MALTHSWATLTVILDRMLETKMLKEIDYGKFYGKDAGEHCDY